MITGTPFPISIDQLTTDTLSVALGSPVESFTSERIGADRGMLGEIFVVRPRFAAGADGPESVICKFAALREGALASAKRGGNNERELRCYDEMLAGTGLSTPHFFHAWYDPDTAHFLLVQEAITADSNLDQVQGLRPELVRLVTAEAAMLHHGRWDDPALGDVAWLPRLDDPRRINNLTTIATVGWQPLCELLGDQLTPQEQQLGTEFPVRLEAALRDLAELPSTLIHSDLRADNLLFSPDHTSVSLIDWQGAGVGPGSFDIAYLLSHALTVDDRRTHGDALNGAYLADLHAAGTTQSLEDFMQGYQLGLYYGLAVACALPVVGDANEPRVGALAAAMARRSIEALRDYDQLW